MKIQWRRQIVIFTFLAALLLYMAWQIGWIGLWSQGIAYIANQSNEFSDKNGHVMQGEYSISIDLSDLKSNMNKELYNDGTQKIYVAWIDNTGSTNTGGYRIGFRSNGEYSASYCLGRPIIYY